jgi:ATP-dependent protease ClpP protease subunit
MDNKNIPDIWGNDHDDEGTEIKAIGNDIYFYTPVLPQHVSNVVEDLRNVSNKLLTQSIESGVNKFHINLHINSGGGYITSGIAMMEAVRLCKVPVHVIIDGCCASAATFPLMVARKRIICKDSYILIHQLSSGSYGKYEELKDDMKNRKEFMKQIRKLYLSKTNIGEKKLNKILKHDLWFNAKKSLKLGLVDEII